MRYAAFQPQATRRAQLQTTAPARTPEERAQDAYGIEDFATAEIEYGKAIALHPTPKLYYNRAVVRGARGELTAAESDLKAALVLDPREPMALFAMGRLALERHDFDEASHRFAVTLEATPARAAMARRIAQAYYGAQRYADAAAYWDRTVEADEAADLQKARDLASDCWARTRMGADLRKAHDLCEQSLTLAPADVQGLVNAGFCDFRQGSFKEAVARFDQALVLEPGSAYARFGRSLAERKLGEPERANADRDEAISANPKVADGLESFTSP